MLKIKYHYMLLCLNFFIILAILLDTSLCSTQAVEERASGIAASSASSQPVFAPGSVRFHTPSNTFQTSTKYQTGDGRVPDFHRLTRTQRPATIATTHELKSEKNSPGQPGSLSSTIMQLNAPKRRNSRYDDHRRAFSAVPIRADARNAVAELLANAFLVVPSEQIDVSKLVSLRQSAPSEGHRMAQIAIFMFGIASLIITPGPFYGSTFYDGVFSCTPFAHSYLTYFTLAYLVPCVIVQMLHMRYSFTPWKSVPSHTRIALILACLSFSTFTALPLLVYYNKADTMECFYISLVLLAILGISNGLFTSSFGSLIYLFPDNFVYISAMSKSSAVLVAAFVYLGTSYSQYKNSPITITNSTTTPISGSNSTQNSISSDSIQSAYYSVIQNAVIYYAAYTIMLIFIFIFLQCVYSYSPFFKHFLSFDIEFKDAIPRGTLEQRPRLDPIPEGSKIKKSQVAPIEPRVLSIEPDVTIDVKKQEDKVDSDNQPLSSIPEGRVARPNHFSIIMKDKKTSAYPLMVFFATVIFLAYSPFFPKNIVSSTYSQDSPYGSTFIPLVLCIGYLSNMLGGIASIKKSWRPSKSQIITILIIRVLMTPLVMLCNLRSTNQNLSSSTCISNNSDPFPSAPRSIKSDEVYITLHIILSFFDGYIMSWIQSEAPNSVEDISKRQSMGIVMSLMSKFAQIIGPLLSFVLQAPLCKCNPFYY